MENIIYLSICIPTFNRDVYLDSTINSIVSQAKFHQTNQVEIVICDNNSTDSTSQIVERYIRIYGDRIKYYKNEKNIAEANVERVLKLGNGMFLKLNNDTLNHLPNSLDILLESVKSNKNQKPELFFSNGLVRANSKFTYSNLNCFVKDVSFYSTWIACFGIWKQDVNKISNFESILNEKLIINVLFNQIQKKKLIKVENSIIFNSILPAVKGGYNFYEIFAGNYVNIVKKYYKNNQITYKVFYLEKSKLLLRYLIPWTIIFQNKNSNFNFSKNKWFSIIWNQYKFHPILYLGVFYFFIKKLYNKF